jgi:hypothetical protein
MRHAFALSLILLLVRGGAHPITICGSAAPATPAVTDNSVAVTLGVKFWSSQPGSRCADTGTGQPNRLDK